MKKTQEKNNDSSKKEDTEIGSNLTDSINIVKPASKTSKGTNTINRKKDKLNNSSINIILSDILNRKSTLEEEIKSLEKKKEAIMKDIKSSFKGQSEDIAIRVKGFQDYLSGALQDLSQSVEKLELVSQPIVVKPSPLDDLIKNSEIIDKETIPALSDTFKPDEDIIKKCFDSFKNQPDFYAEPWKLRRSLDSSDIEILNDWFFNMGGRGALPSKGTRQKNALISAALISILGELYGDQFQTLILASEPERLGEWRRILQDSLGLTREDFGPNSGIVLFERPEGVIERADRLEENEEVPLIIIDASETSVDIPILQFPLWLAFSGTNDEIYNDLDFN